MEIKNLQGKVLFKSDSPSIKETVEDALYKGIILNDVYLSGEDLKGANLRGANLRGAYLINADLRGADLTCANLTYANLNNANLGGAKLNRANLSHADLNLINLNEAKLRDTDLSRTNLRCAYLRGASLINSDLRGANLKGSYLMDADFEGACLSGANLNGVRLNKANLSNADLRGANLKGSDLREAKNVPYIPLACPSEGSFIGWKKIRSNANDEYLVKLRIPEDARRSSATSSKCRCDKAEVLAIECLLTGEKDVKIVVNHTYHECTYKVGEMVYPDSFDEDRWNECSHGIHFFINKQDAIDY